MKTSSPGSLKTDIQDRDLCINCGACTELCPYFKSYKGKIAMIFNCTLGQGKCFAHCPKAEVDLDELSLFFHQKPYDGHPLGHFKSIHVSRAGETMARVLFQNGGTVSSLISCALNNGVIDHAILTDKNGILPEPRLVNTTEDTLHCATSKYLAAPTLGELNKAMQNKLSNIGLVGTPCQMIAAALTRMNPMNQDGFKDPVSLSIGLFCTWALDTRKFMTFISSKMEIRDIKRMDIPPPPAGIAVIEKDREIINIPLEDIRPLILEGCSVCPDMTAEFSDISVGTFEDNPEWNTLIIRTEKGEQLVEDACKKGYLTLSDLPEKSLDHLLSGAGMKKKKAILKAGTEGLMNTLDNSKPAVLRMPESLIKTITK
ncbi:MAG: Coenzyme F420 hydrogenase/dehydrogenase, beta subunit C-terminal domain [Proteobacteria bacterium]|nr:Coenzyme F420 hydrogenase/dehydrogenase, beta subunit C-terminal domain [Pseudomonadota bacterium]